MKILKVPGSLKIRQLVVSPEGDFIAIVTSHTVHVAVLPNPILLNTGDTAPLKLKSFQLGPTTHVVECSGVASVLWHPLGANGNTLVTVTTDAIVRLWELNREDRGSFETPTLAVDLKKLADARSSTQDCSPSRYGTRKGFSPDSFEMEVASACFGAPATGWRAGWAPLTLWIAMKEGDVYFLCPLLPSLWQAEVPTITALASSVRLDNAILLNTDNVSSEVRHTADQQLRWVSEIESQIKPTDSTSRSSPVQTFRRPPWPSHTPKLQGPFHLSPDPDQIFDIADIHSLVVEPEEDPGSDYSSTDEDKRDVEQIEIICLATSDGKIHVCTSLSTVEPKWLPTKKVGGLESLEIVLANVNLMQSAPLLSTESSDDNLEMLIVESVSLSANGQECPLVFSRDAESSASAIITSSNTVYQLDLSPLANKLCEELQSGSDTGSEFRIGMLVDNSRLVCERLLSFDDTVQSASERETAAACSLLDADMGHLVLSSRANQPNAVILEPKGFTEAIDNFDTALSPQTLKNVAGLLEARPAYQPPSAFWAESTLAGFLDAHVHSRSRQSLSSEVRLSPSTLKLLMDAHRVLSEETHRLGLAASDLFARCERLQDEFREQLRRAQSVADRVDSVTGIYDDEYYDQGGGGGGHGADGIRGDVEERLMSARATQESLHVRYDELRRKLGLLNSGRPLSDRERAWGGEVERFARLVLGEARAEHAKEDETSPPHAEAAERLEEVRRLRDQLLDEYREQKPQEGNGTADLADAASPASSAAFNVALDRRRARSAEIEELLERQSALVQATKTKLERLSKMGVV